MADQTSLANRVAELEPQVQRVETLQKSVGEWPDIMGQRAKGLVEEMSVLTDVIDLRIDGMQADLNLLKRAVSREEDRAPLSKVKVLDSKAFGGERSAEELENFLWDVKTYFQAAKVPEAEKVSITRIEGSIPPLQYKLGCKGVPAKSEAYRDRSCVCQGVQFSPIGCGDMSEEDKLFNFMAEAGRSGKVRQGSVRSFKRKEKAKEVVTETSEPRAVEKSRDGDSETEQTRVGALQLSVLQAEFHACVESCYKGLMMVTGQINVKAVNSEAMPVSGVATTELRVGSWSGQCDFMAVRLDDFDEILAFVRGEYEGDTTARKKSKSAEAGPSNASSSKEGAHSPHVAGFCCIGKMQEEMDRRWAKAQQDCEAGPELFTYADVLKRERECEGKHSFNVHGEKRALVQSTSGKKEGKIAASTRASTSVGGGGL
ncbi:UNVERIFIED_CONTAM: hypothetical protein Slati_2147200 [Sesamum latifolium]|uniref:Uncharacterized protein n=1 Tax=Sesamum latifolium TaxID=2727402 RepID=A0AAW2WS33_9LAMI